MTGSMAPNANDFATFTGEIFAEMVDPSKITKKAKKAFDKEMKFNDPTFVGLDSQVERMGKKCFSRKKKDLY